MPEEDLDLRVERRALNREVDEATRWITNLAAAVKARDATIAELRVKLAECRDEPAPTPEPTPTPPPPTTGARKPWTPVDPNRAPTRAELPTKQTAGLVDPSKLTVRSGTVTARPGDVFENLDIRGRVDATGGTFRNCKFSCQDYYNIRIFNETRGLVIEDCEIDGLSGPQNALIGGGEASWVLRRSYLHGAEDAIKITRDCVVEDCYIAENSAPSSEPDPHYDGIQSMIAAYGIRIYHNWIELPKKPGNTSCVFLKTDFGPIKDATIAYNFVSGGSHTITNYDAGRGHGPPTGTKIHYNRFGGAPPKGFADWGAMNINGGSPSIVGNIWDADGSPVK